MPRNPSTSTDRRNTVGGRAAAALGPVGALPDPPRRLVSSDSVPSKAASTSSSAPATDGWVRGELVHDQSEKGGVWHVRLAVCPKAGPDSKRRPFGHTACVDRLTGIAVGVDVAESRKGLDLVAIDDQRQLVAVHSRLIIEDVVRLIAALRPDIVCIDSPPQWSTSGNSGQTERELSRLGINAFRTPPEERAGPFHAWMRVGIALYDALAGSYPRYRGDNVIRTAAEYFPHASAAVLAGSVHAMKDKRAFRRQVLEANRVPTSSLTTIDQIDAALGALTGHIAVAGGSSFVGDPDEGALLLPTLKPLARLPRALGQTFGPARPMHPVRSASGPVTNASAARVCGCGCGATVRREFLPGHDAKLRSRLLAQAKLSDDANMELRRRNWL